MSRPKPRYEPWKLAKDGDDRCNLCLLVKPMSEDHVPPRCVGNDKPVKIRRFYHDQHLGKFPYAIRVVRGGITFKTLCQDCNSLIGQWDPSLKTLVAAAKSAHRRGDLILKGDIKMGAVVRAVLGHFIAAKLVIDDSEPDKTARDYLLNGSPLDPMMNIHLWHYPYDDLAIARDFVVTDLKDKVNTGILSVMKFRPLAMCSSFDGPSLKYPSIAQYSLVDPSTEVPVSFSLGDRVDSLWPEHASHVNPFQALTAGEAYGMAGIESRGTEVANASAGGPGL